jgi:hypothetical protein
MTEQHQALIDDLGRKKRGHIPHIVRWTDRVHVDRYDIETGKAAQKLDALARRQTPQLLSRSGRMARPIPSQFNWYFRL